MMKFSLVNGPYDGVEVVTENDIYDFPIVENSYLEPLTKIYTPTLHKVHRYRRGEEWGDWSKATRSFMFYEGIVDR